MGGWARAVRREENLGEKKGLTCKKCDLGECKNTTWGENGLLFETVILHRVGTQTEHGKGSGSVRENRVSTHAAHGTEPRAECTPGGGISSYSSPSPCPPPLTDRGISIELSQDSAWWRTRVVVHICEFCIYLATLKCACMTVPANAFFWVK